MRDETDFAKCLVKAQNIIDAERARNAKLLTERDALRARVADLENATMSEQGIEDMGWMRLPVDKDGVPVRPGETVYGPDGRRHVVCYVSDANEFACFSGVSLMPYIHADECSHVPERFPLDADGVECRPGDTVFTKAGARIEVDDISRGNSLVVVRYEDGRELEYRAYNLTHAEPDSWERLERDSGKYATDEYWGCAGVACDECPSKIDGKTPAAFYGCAGCTTAIQLDVLRRARALAGATPKCSEAAPKGDVE